MNARFLKIGFLAFLTLWTLSGCSTTEMKQVAEGFYLKLNPVGWCMSEYTFIKDEAERRKHCEGKFIADQRQMDAEISKARAEMDRTSGSPSAADIVNTFSQTLGVIAAQQSQSTSQASVNNFLPSQVSASPINSSTTGQVSDANNSSSPRGPEGSAQRVKRSDVPEAHATHCLAPQREGGVINNCAFAIEYVYCVVQPKPGSWSASFDCNQNKTGSWQVGANSRAIMQTAGYQVAYFGCRYGPTISKPDGISPAGFQYNPNGLPTGRCAEWGAR